MDGVGRTALGAARLRAIESLRPDRLFADDLAALFLDPPPDPPPADADAGPWADLLASVAIRTRFVDDGALGATAAGGRQIVILGAGLDTRAFRLPWPPGCALFEVDFPAVLEFKRSVLDRAGVVPACARHAVPADLVGDWTGALTAAGLDPGRPVIWICEGVLLYLAPPDADRLVTRLGELSGPGSHWLLTHTTQDALDRWRTQTSPDSPGATAVGMWRSGIAGDAAAWLAARGWAGTPVTLADQAAAYGRPFRNPSATSWLIAAARAASNRPPRREPPVTDRRGESRR